MYLLFDAENQIDPQVCRTAEDLRTAISDLDGQPFQVLTIAVDEFCRDVTDEFLPADEYPDPAASAADFAYQAAREAML